MGEKRGFPFLWITITVFLCGLCLYLGIRIGTASHADFTISPERSAIPVQEDQTKVIEAKNRADSSVYPINLNTADAEMLQLLPGIGPAKAEAIVAYRENNGKFISKEDLLQVSGIGEETLTEIRDLIEISETQ